jgi:sugar (pentulose or hexulose) kinase
VRDLLIGLDAGSSFLKAAVIDTGRETLLHTGRVPFPGFEPGLPPLHREVDPRKILGAAQSLLAPLDSAGLILCGQMHGFVLVDARGEPVSNYISWLDQRVSAEEFAAMSRLVTENERAELGHEFRPGLALAQLWWLKQHDMLPKAAMPVSIADFIAARIAGVTPVMEPTQAAAFGALRLRTLAWHEEVIGKLGLDSLRWPEVRPSGTPMGKWRSGPVFASVGDQQCALAGALVEPRELSVNIGTGSQVGLLADAPGAGAHQTRPYFGGRFLRTITHIPGGRALSALVGLLTEIGQVAEEAAWQRIESEVAAVQKTDMRAGIAFFPGACGDRGFLENLHEGNLSIGHVFRAVFESMAANYAACARRLDPERSAARVVFSGGVARRLALLRELTAGALQLPARLSPHAEDTLYGLMVLAREWMRS